MMNPLRIYLGCLWLFACTQMPPKSPEIADAWVRIAPKSAFEGLTELGSADVFPVAEDHVHQAIGELENHHVVAITPVRAAELAGRVLPGGDYYLVRAVCGACSTGGYFVYFGQAGRLVVAHLSLSSQPPAPTRWPIVVRLPGVPTDVYVQFSTNE